MVQRLVTVRIEKEALGNRGARAREPELYLAENDLGTGIRKARDKDNLVSGSARLGMARNPKKKNAQKCIQVRDHVSYGYHEFQRLASLPVLQYLLCHQ